MIKQTISVPAAYIGTLLLPYRFLAIKWHWWQLSSLYCLVRLKIDFFLMLASFQNSVPFLSSVVARCLFICLQITTISERLMVVICSERPLNPCYISELLPFSFVHHSLRPVTRPAKLPTTNVDLYQCYTHTISLDFCVLSNGSQCPRKQKFCFSNLPYFVF